MDAYTLYQEKETSLKGGKGLKDASGSLDFFERS